MKAFRATHIKELGVSEKDDLVETVLVIKILDAESDGSAFPLAVFIRNDNTMSVDDISSFKNCQSDWGDK